MTSSPKVRDTLSEAREATPPARVGGHNKIVPDEGMLRTLREYEGAGTLSQLSKLLGISINTFKRLFSEHEDFRNEVLRVRHRADDLVETAMFKRATGYTETVKKMNARGDIVEVEQSYPPDTGAAKFWLANRRRAQWAEPEAAPPTDPVTQAMLDRIEQALANYKSEI